MKTIALAAAASLLLLGACSDKAEAPAAAQAAPAAPAAPPLPDLPMTEAKAIAMLEGTALPCKTVASLRFEMNRCEQKTGAGPDDAGFRQELGDFRASLAGLDAAEIQTRCSARYAELERTPMPQACWGDR